MSSLFTLDSDERLARLLSTDATLHTFLCLDESVLTAPRASRVLAVKDNIDVRGLPTTDGIRALSRTPAADAAVVARARRAGALVLGKTNMSELAMGPVTKNRDWDETPNPFDTDRISGGSSGGSAAAIAAGFVDLALGTDTGGSGRNPASYCGVVGFRPTAGRLPMLGVSPVSTVFDTVSPMARTAADLDWLLGALDPWNETAAMRPLRVGIPSAFFFDSAHADVADAVASVPAVLPDLLTPTAIDLSHAADVLEPAGILINAHAYAQITDRLDESALSQLEPQVAARILAGKSFSANDLDGAEEVRAAWGSTVSKLWANADVILTPTTPTAAPLRTAEEEHLSIEINRFTRPWILAPTPALSFPVGMTRAGLPIGAQLIGPPHSDRLLVALVGAFQERTDWHQLTSARGLQP